MALPVIGHVVTLKARRDGYATTYAGRRWILTNPTPGTGVTAQTSFAATTPFILINQASAAGVWPLTLATLSMTQVGTVAGGVITIAVLADTTDRYSSGGTLLTPQRMGLHTTSTTAGFTARTNPTAAAASANVSKIFEFQVPANVSSPAAFSLDFIDAVKIGPTGSILIYAFAATTGPTLTFDVELIEEQDTD